LVAQSHYGARLVRGRRDGHDGFQLKIRPEYQPNRQPSCLPQISQRLGCRAGGFQSLNSEFCRLEQSACFFKPAATHRAGLVQSDRFLPGLSGICFGTIIATALDADHGTGHLYPVLENEPEDEIRSVTSQSIRSISSELPWVFEDTADRGQALVEGAANG